MEIVEFSDWKREVFRCSKEIKDLHGGVHRYAAQVSLQIDATTAEKSRFWMETNSVAVE